MMRNAIFLFLLAGCSYSGDTNSYVTQSSTLTRKPLLAILPMENCTENLSSKKIADAFTRLITKRLEQKNHFSLTSFRTSGKDFLVQMQLIQHQQTILDSPELAISVHLKILDLRSDKPQIILQEVINHSTMLENFLHKYEFENSDSPAFRVSPIGLAHAKVSREIVSRIEDYIRFATKGNI